MLVAHRILKKLGGLEAIVNARLTPINPSFAQDGDVGLYKNSLMLFTGHHIVGPGVEGLMFISRVEARCAWRCA
jgi:hypothetical protein